MWMLAPLSPKQNPALHVDLLWRFGRLLFPKQTAPGSLLEPSGHGMSSHRTGTCTYCIQRKRCRGEGYSVGKGYCMERAGWPNFVNVCANFCVLYVMRAVLKKGNWISLLLRVWNMEPQPEMVVENNATTILQQRVLINLFDLYWMLLEVYIQKKFFAAWSGNTRRRSSES